MAVDAAPVPPGMSAPQTAVFSPTPPQGKTLSHEQNHFCLFQFLQGGFKMKIRAGWCILYAPSLTSVQRETHFNNHWQVPIGSHTQFPTFSTVNFHCFQLCSNPLHPCQFMHIINIWLIEKDSGPATLVKEGRPFQKGFG